VLRAQNFQATKDTLPSLLRGHQQTAKTTIEKNAKEIEDRQELVTEIFERQ
jgi:hypothetical protein